MKNIALLNTNFAKGFYKAKEVDRPDLLYNVYLKRKEEMNVKRRFMSVLYCLIFAIEATFSLTVISIFSQYINKTNIKSLMATMIFINIIHIFNSIIGYLSTFNFKKRPEFIFKYISPVLNFIIAIYTIAIVNYFLHFESLDEIQPIKIFIIVKIYITFAIVRIATKSLFHEITSNINIKK